MATPLPLHPTHDLPLPPTGKLPAGKMKAILQPAWGQPEVLRLAEVDLPEPQDDEVRVRVVAAGLNRGDWYLLTGTPYLVRVAGYGLLRPKKPIPGMAIAGRVEAVGARVEGLQVGDHVMGEINRGGFAEYACAKGEALAHIPAGVSFEDAACLPVAGTTALQGLRDAGRLQRGQSVLINGAAGGVGTFAVQLARAMGAEVTAVCSAGNTALVRSLGAEQVIDYGQEDFTRGPGRYDLVFDLVGNHPLAACRRVLVEGGRMVAAAGGADNPWLGPVVGMIAGLASNLVSDRPFVSLMNRPDARDLATLGAFVDAGTIRPVIDRRYTLAQVPEAMRALGLGHTRGKSVVSA